MSRAVLPELLCPLTMALEEVAETWAVAFEYSLEAAMPMMEKMETAGMVDVAAPVLTVQEPGRMMLRPLCL